MLSPGSLQLTERAGYKDGAPPAQSGDPLKGTSALELLLRLTKPVPPVSPSVVAQCSLLLPFYHP